MHVAMAVPWAPWSKTGGTERHAHELASALVRQGKRVTVIVPAPTPPMPSGLPYAAVVIDNWRVRALHGLENAIRPGRATWRQLRDRELNHQAEVVAKRLGADVLHRHFIYSAPFRPTLPLVLTLHNAMLPRDESEGKRARLAAWDQRRREAATAQAILDADQVICVSDHVRHGILGRLGTEVAVQVVPNGCPYSTPEYSKLEARKELGLGSYRVILFIGHLWHLKGVERLLPLLDDPQNWIVLIGRGPLKEKLDALAKAQPRLRVLDYVDEIEKLRWLRAADVVTLPSGWFEGQGIVLLEALRCGTPVHGTWAEWLPGPLRAFGLFGQDVNLAPRAAKLDASGAPGLVPQWDEVAIATFGAYQSACESFRNRLG